MDSIVDAMNKFTTNFFSSPASKAAVASYEAARAAICNPDATGKCRPGTPPTTVVGSLFGATSGNTFGPLFPGATTVSTSGGTSVFGGLFFLAAILFVLFLLLMFINTTVYPIFSFSMNEPGLISIPLSTDRELSYKKVGLAIPTTRRDTDTGNTDNVTTLPICCNYTIGVDIFINGGLTPITYPHVLLYRDLSGASVTAGTAAAATPSNLAEKYPNTNLIVWLDKATNNLNVTIVTKDSGLNEKLQNVSPIENVPLNKLFRLVVVLADSFVEVYINGELLRTMQVSGNLKGIGSATASTDFYPPVTEYTEGGVRVSNMSMWPRVITAREIRTYEATPMTS